MHRTAVSVGLSAVGLLRRSEKRRYWLLVVIGAGSGLLDFLGILLLLPLMAYLSGEPASALGSSLDGVYVRTADALGQLDERQMAVLLAAVAVGVFIAKGVIAVCVSWFQAGILNDAERRISRELLSGFSASDWLTQQQVTSGEFLRATVLSIHTAVQAARSLSGLFSDLVIFVVVFAAVFVVDPLLAAVIAGVLLLFGAVFVLGVQARIQRSGIQVQLANQAQAGALLELVGGIREMVVRDVSGRYVDAYGVAVDQFLRAKRFADVVGMSVRYVLEALLVLSVGSLVVLLYLVGSEASAFVAIGLVLAGGIRLLPALNMLVVNLNTLRASQFAIETVHRDLARFPVVKVSPETAGATARLEGAFRFAGVTFRYPSRPENALHEVSVDVHAGEVIGIVGGSGAGKSTFVDLLLGLIEPTEGHVLVDGQPLADRAVARAWRRGVGVVPQEVFLLDASLEENIAFGLEIDPDRMQTAVETAQLAPVVRSLPHGLSTPVGERGVALSGGQRQRVGLARAVYIQPQLLLLDEATSALDNETEVAVGEALDRLKGEVTMVVIAHRLSTLKICDRIYYLVDGQIADSGSFEELVGRNATFRYLVELADMSGFL